MTLDITQTLLYDKTLGCLLGGLIGDAIGTPTENMDFRRIEQEFGWVDDFEGEGTDDTIMKNLLAEALVRTDGWATMDDWGQVWLDRWDEIFGEKVGKFFISVLHTAHKLRRHTVPRMAGLGNMPSSSSAMCISPVGIVNAGDPRQAALQAYNLAGLIHSYDVGFCQDGAAAMAAAVAAASAADATVDSILTAAREAIMPLSGSDMHQRVMAAIHLAEQIDDYEGFRTAVYDQTGRFFQRITCDSRETVPLALALFSLGQGDVERCVVYAANLGRDADTIASMCGALAGAYEGRKGIREDWVARVLDRVSTDQETMAERLVKTARRKHEQRMEARHLFEQVSQAEA